LPSNLNLNTERMLYEQLPYFTQNDLCRSSVVIKGLLAMNHIYPHALQCPSEIELWFLQLDAFCWR